MTDLTPMTALGANAAETIPIGPYELREDIGLALASLACTDDVTPFGLALPGPGKMIQDTQGRSAIWMGKGLWLIAAHDQAESDFAQTLRQDLGQKVDAKVTEQTDAWVAFEITAPSAQDIQAVLAHLVNLPNAATEPGCAARTLVHHMSVFVLRPDNQQLTFLGLRSYAQSLHDVLEETLRRRLRKQPSLSNTTTDQI